MIWTRRLSGYLVRLIRFRLAALTIRKSRVAQPSGGVEIAGWRLHGRPGRRQPATLGIKPRYMMLMLLPVLAAVSAACMGESQAELHNSAGVRLGNQGKYEEAVAEFDQAIRLDPELALGYYNRGRVNYMLEKYQLAIQDYDQAIPLHPQPALIYTRRGEAYSRLGNNERAIQDHDEAIRREPKGALAFFHRAGAYLELGQRDLAIQIYGKAVIVDRRFDFNSPISSYRCLLYEDLKRYQPAIKDCKSLSRIDRRMAQAFRDRGSEFYELGQYKRAIRDFDKSIRLDASAEVYNDRGLANQKAGNVDKAFEDFERAAGGPEFAEPYFNRGRLYSDLGYYKYAVDDYSLAIGRDPSYADAYANRAIAYVALKKDNEAQLDIERAVDLGAGRAELELEMQEMKGQR